MAAEIDYLRVLRQYRVQVNIPPAQAAVNGTPDMMVLEDKDGVIRIVCNRFLELFVEPKLGFHRIAAAVPVRRHTDKVHAVNHFVISVRQFYDAFKIRYCVCFIVRKFVVAHNSQVLGSGFDVGIADIFELLQCFRFTCICQIAGKSDSVKFGVSPAVRGNGITAVNHQRKPGCFRFPAGILQVHIACNREADNRREIIRYHRHVHHTGFVKNIGGESHHQRHHGGKRTQDHFEDFCVKIH